MESKPPNTQGASWEEWVSDFVHRRGQCTRKRGVWCTECTDELLNKINEIASKERAEGESKEAGIWYAAITHLNAAQRDSVLATRAELRKMHAESTLPADSTEGNLPT